MLSLLLKNARVIDGTGAKSFESDIAVSRDRIVAIEPRIDAPAERTIDAKGFVAAPGFIDVHAHGELTIFSARTADSKILDGVTTEILGNCGYSPFPGRSDEERYGTASEFFDAVERSGSSINRAFLAGLGSIRTFVMGRTARAAEPADIKAMQTEVESALAQGVIGVSSGLIYPPGCFASKEELAEVARPAGEAGTIYATHMRSESDSIEDAIAEAEFIARQSGAKLQISHVKLSGKRNWKKIDWLDERLHALANEIDFGCDRYPYIASATDIGVILPNWVHEGSVDQRMERLHNADVRIRAAEEVANEHPEPGYWDSIMISSAPDGADTSIIGKSIRRIAELQSKPPIDVVMDLLAQHRQKASAIFFSMCEENLRRIISWPFVGAGSDARARGESERESGEMPHPRAYGTFARFIGKYAREEKIFSIEEAVRKITSMPAERFRLDGRGVLKAGAFADIVICNPDKIIDRATFDKPHQHSAGIHCVIVNGVPVVENCKHNGGLPGRVLRRKT